MSCSNDIPWCTVVTWQNEWKETQKASEGGADVVVILYIYIILICPVEKEGFGFETSIECLKFMPARQSAVQKNKQFTIDNNRLVGVVHALLFCVYACEYNGSTIALQYL